MQLMLKRMTEKLQRPYSPIPLLDNKFYQQKKKFRCRSCTERNFPEA